MTNPLTAAARIVFPDRDPGAVAAGELESGCLDWLKTYRPTLQWTGYHWRVTWTDEHIWKSRSRHLPTSTLPLIRGELLDHDLLTALARAVLAVAERPDHAPPKDTR